MYILGINCALNASVVVLRDDVVVFAAQEERYSREKNAAGFPEQALAGALRQLGIAAEDISLVCVGGMDSKIPESRWSDLNKYARRYADVQGKWYGGGGSLRPQRLRNTLGSLRRKLRGGATVSALDQVLRARGLDRSVVTVDPHSCHAAAATYGPPWPA